MELTGAQRVIAQLGATEAQLTRLARAEELVGIEGERAGRRGFLMNQALFTMRRLAYSGTLVLIGLGAAATTMGFRFNMSMESNMLAFKSFLGSAQAARQELNFLYDLAAKTPFEFTQLALGSRQLMAFGMNVETVNRTMTGLADAMSAMGLSTEAIGRATLALGQIQSSGKLLGQDLRQLEQLGLVQPQDLAQRLGLDPAAMSNVGALNIPSNVAIDAIVSLWEDKFHGAAAEFQHTFIGQISTIHDYASRLFGMKSFPLFRSLEKTTLPHISKMILDMTKELQRNPDASMFDLAKIADKDLNAGGRLLNMFRLLDATLGTFVRFIRGSLLPAMAAVATSLPVRVLLGAVVALGTVLDILINKTGVFKYVVEALLFVLLVEKGLLIANWLWSSRTVALMIRMTMITKLLRAAKLLLIGAQILYNIVFDKEYRLAIRWIIMQNIRLVLGSKIVRMYKLWVAWMFLSNRAQNGGFAAGYKNNSMLARLSRTIYNLTFVRLKNFILMVRYRLIPALVSFTAEVWASTAALLVNPIFLLATAVLVLTVGLTILYFKWKRFHDLVNRTFSWIQSHIWIAAFLGPVIGPLMITIKLVRTLYDWFSRLRNFFRHPLRIRITLGSGLNILKKVLGFALNPAGFLTRRLPGAKYLDPTHWIPHWAKGGTQQMAGHAVVGEAGPELVTLPAGARITPIGSSALGGGMPIFPETINLRAILRVDGRDIAEVVSRHRLDRAARR
jgi:tape measure domain-containing protein